jgi:hypothetical protein
MSDTSAFGHNGSDMVRTSAVLTSIPLVLGSFAAQPNLVESSLRVSQRAASVRVTDVVRNTGPAAAGRSTAGYYLGTLRVGNRAVARLGAGAVSRATVTLAIPASLPVGTYRLRACADVTRRVRESSERDNCRTATQAVRITDRTPPVFAGLEAATTCLPGPQQNGRSTAFHLRWAAAHDDRTPADALVYDVYQATAAGAENFAAPTYASQPGATTFSTPPLSNDKTYYFVVRARDAAGNRDGNKVEQQGMNLCL